jgi:hypothetical protein
MVGVGRIALAVGFVVKAHVARHDGEVERATRLADPPDRADELAHDLGLLGIAEVEVVGRGQRRAPQATRLRQASATACLPPSTGFAFT